MRISACVIVKNEERNLPLWLDSMSRIADELVVVDTGSTDRTVEIAEAAGVRVEYFPWVDDFSAAKNFAIEQAAGDWILLLDADEYFLSEDCPKVRAAIEKYHPNRNVAGLMFQRVDIERSTGREMGGSIYVIRAFRNVPWLRYVKRIHEELRNISGKGLKIMQYVKDLVIYHTGYSTDVFQSKVQRNLDLLLKNENREPIDDFYLADCYYSLGRYEEAISRLQQLLGARVKMMGMENDPYILLIHSMMKASRPSEEIYQVLGKAVEKYPESADFYMLWGLQDWNDGNYAMAERHYLQGLERYRKEKQGKQKRLLSSQSLRFLPTVYLHLGELAAGQGRRQEAAAYFEKVLDLQPENQIAGEKLRLLRQDSLSGDAGSAGAKDAPMEQRREAPEKLREKIYGALERQDYGAAREALPQLLPYNKVEALELMTCVEIEQGNAAAAEEMLRKLRAAQRKQTPYQSFLAARILFMQYRIIETLQILKQVDCSRATPEQQEKIYNLMGQCHKFLGETEKSTECYLRAFRVSAQREAASWEYSNYLFNLHYLPVSIPEQRKAAEGYQKIFEDIPWFSHTLPSGKKPKLRIGYISPDLRKHVVLRFSHVLFSKYDRSRFEVFLYANNPEDGYSADLASKVDGWRNILGWSAERAARAIYEDGIDILVDLAGHTSNNCLPVLAYKPAPIQISGIGYFASTGLRAVDYFLGDVHMDNEETEQGFTEELLLLPDSHFCYSEMKNEASAGEPPCKKKGYITFGSFNDFPKVNDRVLETWGQILHQLPDARLLLKAKVFEREDSREAMLRRIKKAGIPLDRVETRGTSKVYMPEYNDMDIALDTFPYPGGGTTCDALYMGVPVISLRGKSHGERFGASLLENIGLAELCADTPEAYVQTAVSLARDPELVEMLHGNLRAMMRNSPLMRAASYMRNMETAYEAVWERYVRERQSLVPGAGEKGGSPPRPFVHELARHRHEKVRIGYLSPAFGIKPISCFASALFRNYDPYTCEIYAYSLGTSDDVAEWLRGRGIRWREFSGASAAEVAQRIYEDEIDLLVFLPGREKSEAARILRYRPAPVQLCGMGYGSSMDPETADYFLADPELPEKLAVPAEKLMLLPHSRLCYQAVPGMPDYIAPAPYRRTGHVAFGCIEPPERVADDMLRAWKEILEKTEGAVLLLKSYGADAPRNPERNWERMARAGLPMERIFPEEPAPNDRAYYDAYQSIDILLDACVPSEDGRICDALYMGVPVITLRGGIASGMLATAGLEKLCGDSLQEYIAAAVSLANHPEELSDLHLTLRWRLESTPAMNGDRYMPELEAAYGSIWCDWQRAHSEDFSAWQEQIWQELDRADAAGDWAVAARKGTWLAWAMDGHERVPFWTAAAYYFLKVPSRSIYWGEKAARQDARDERSLYPRVWGLDRSGRRMEAVELCNWALRYKDEMRDELRRTLLSQRAHMAYLSGAQEMSRYFWEAYEDEKAGKSRLGNFHSWLLTYNCQEVDRAVLLEKHRSYEKLFRDVRPYRHSGKPRHEKIRVGYVSPDFRKHVMYEFVRPFFQCYDRDNFEVYAYSLTREPDECTDQLKQLADGWREADPYAPEQTAKQIWEDEIDILFDLAGHTSDTGLPAFAWKPAPVQISGIGYMTTTGLPAVDYFLTDGFVDPPGEHEEDFVEQLLRVRSQFCYRSLTENLPEPRMAPSRERGWILFGAFNAYHKLTDEMLLAWNRILEGVPKSKILLKCQVFFAPGMKLAAYERLQRLGFDMDRVILEPATKEYMERYLDVDIALDTYPYPGGGTTCDALYMGVPVITRYSDRHSTRFGYSILQNIGIGELAAGSVEEYIEKAVAVARDRELLEYLHQSLRRMMEKSPVMDMKGYMKEIEERYREIWNQHIGN